MKAIHIAGNAVRNHEEIFPNYESRLQKTDPEFIGLFDNRAFDEVIGQSQLDTKTRVIIRGWLDRQGDFEKEFGGCFGAGKLKNRETVVPGIENAVDAFIGLFGGKNIGRRVVKLD